MKYCRARYYGPTTHRPSRFGISLLYRGEMPTRPVFFANNYEYTDLDEFMRAGNWEYIFADKDWYYYKSSAPT